MKLVTLVSGGLDSSLMAVLAKESGNKQFPLFIDYGQLGVEKEWEACQRIHQEFSLKNPVRMNISGYGNLISSGLTDANRKIKEEAYLPGRNLIFLLMGAAYATQVGANAVCIGLLNEETHIFSDQTNRFLLEAERLIEISMQKKVMIIAPLSEFFKADVIALAFEKKISGTYSCHTGNTKPCGKCIACEEFNINNREE